MQVAQSEYNDPKRMGFLQYGDQASGVYFSWPGTKWCTTPDSLYDPRFRPWYVSAVSGPKDVIVIVDKSGSMDTKPAPSRWDQVKAATIAVLDTLTAFDRANVVLFSSRSQVAAFQENTLFPVTRSTVKKMTRWLDDAYPMGGTDFRAGFELAFNILQNAVDSSKSTGCNRAILFLTDGKDTSKPSPMDAAEVTTMNAPYGATIFTFSFGTGAEVTKPKQIACANKGIWYHVKDGEDIKGYMVDYYTYYAKALMHTKQVRWTMYKEFQTQNDLFRVASLRTVELLERRDFSVLLAWMRPLSLM